MRFVLKNSKYWTRINAFHLVIIKSTCKCSVLQFTKMVADLLSEWSSEATETQKNRARTSLDVTFRDLSYTVGEGKNE